MTRAFTQAQAKQTCSIHVLTSTACLGRSLSGRSADEKPLDIRLSDQQETPAFLEPGHPSPTHCQPPPILSILRHLQSRFCTYSRSYVSGFIKYMSTLIQNNGNGLYGMRCTVESSQSNCRLATYGQSVGGVYRKN